MDNQKLNHFELIKKLLEDNQSVTLNHIEKICKSYNQKTVDQIVDNIDSNVNFDIGSFGISDNRKVFIKNILELRRQKLTEFVN